MVIAKQISWYQMEKSWKKVWQDCVTKFTIVILCCRHTRQLPRAKNTKRFKTFRRSFSLNFLNAVWHSIHKYFCSLLCFYHDVAEICVKYIYIYAVCPFSTSIQYSIQYIYSVLNSVHIYGTSIQYIYSVHQFSTYIQYSIQYINSVHQFSTYIQYIYSVHWFSTCISWRMYTNIFLQVKHIYNINTHTVSI